jgi:transposase
VFGAFEPQTGHALTMCTAGRATTDFLRLLDQIVLTWPADNLILILDNLATHKTLDVRLWALAHPRVCFLFQPTYAPWLNLIEPWWKTLRSLALKGRRFEHGDELTAAIQMATIYWNQRRKPYFWRKAA